MSNIKMSDVFQLPVSCEEVSEIGVELFDNNEDAYAAFAINNHDRLTKENAQLKADKAELVEALESTLWLTKMSESNFLKFEKLIQKHKEQNNE